jgi:hypothetical protein
LEDHYIEINDFKNPFTLNTISGQLVGTYKTASLVDFKSGISFAEVEDVHLVNPIKKNKNYIELESPTVFFCITDDGIWGHFHMIYEVLAEYEIIKKQFPEVKIKVLQFCEKNTFDFFLSHLRERGVLESYNISQNDLIDMTNISEIKIKKMIFIYTAQNYLAQALTDKLLFYRRDNAFEFWGKELSKLLKKRFLIKKSAVNNKKIFISRREDNERLREISETLYKVFYGYPIEENEKNIFSWLDESLYSMHLDRVPTLLDDLKIEKMFSDAGYEIIDPGSNLRTIREQAELFNSASHIVGMPGAGLVNSCFSNSNAKVLILNNSDSYHFPHKDVIQSFGLFCEESPKRRPGKHKIYSAKEIFESVKRDYPEFLI